MLELPHDDGKHREELPYPGWIPWVTSRSFYQSYIIGELLGSGAFAVVHDAIERRKEPKQQRQHISSYAVKIIDRARLHSKQQVEHFQNEIQIMASLSHHESIIRLHEIYKDSRYFFLVMEKLEGGELFDRLCSVTTYNEKTARDAMKIVFEAVAYCHGKKIAHRDLKPENLLLKNVHDDTSIKLADFGFAKIVDKPNSLRTFCGSMMYTAPEIINYKPYDQRVDNWSLGVILFTILGGYPPFYEDTKHMTYQQIRQCNYCFYPEYWDGISPDAKKLIRSLLTVDTSNRITAREALSSPWMTGRGEDLQQKSLKANQEEFKKFNEERKQSSGPLKSVSMYWLLSRR